MNRHIMGVLRAPVVVALVVAAALMPLWDTAAALLCLPLLVFAWALCRGRTWGAFGLLGTSVAVLFLCQVNLLSWHAGLVAGFGLAGFGLVVPVLWRRDALATSVAAVAVLVLCLGGVIFVTLPVQCSELPLDCFSVDGPCGDGAHAEHEPALPYGQHVNPWQLSVDVRPVEDRWLRLLVTNNSYRSVTLAHPRPGSLHGWQPVYRVTAQDAEGLLLQVLPPAPSPVAAPGPMTEHNTTLVQPGETFSVAFPMPRFDGVPARVTFTYGFDPRLLDDQVGWAATPEMERRRAAMLVGEIRSPQVYLRKYVEISAPPPLVRGALDKEIIRRVTLKHLGEARACFSEQLFHRNRYGRVVVRYIIAGHGEVLEARVIRSTVRSLLVQRCLTRTIRTWRFPACKCGGIVMVEQPLERIPVAAARALEFF